MSDQEIAAREERRGAFYAFSAFLVWGGIPSAFKLASDVPMLETLSHRVIWSVVVLAMLITLDGRWRRLRFALQSGRNLRILALSSLMLASTWLVFVYAVNNDQILQVSLGYYINPLVTVLLGVVLLRERMSKLQWLAVAIAFGGVLNQALAVGEVPWVSLSLAVLFAFYGYFRKIAKIEALEGLFVETMIMLPFSLAYLAYQVAVGSSAVLAGGLEVLASLIFIGVVSVVPLVLFTAGARRLRLSTMGFMQFLAPTLHFFSAILIWDEALTTAHIITFICIWTAIALYIVPTILKYRRA